MKKTITIAALLLCLSGAAHSVTTELISANSTGVPANGSCLLGPISSDGRYIPFISDSTNLVDNDTNGVQDVFVIDRITGITERASVSSGNPGTQANGASSEWCPTDPECYEPPSVSGNGNYVVFSSSASNLVSGDTNGYRDIFVRDIVNHTTTRVSVSSSGTQANGRSWYPSISSDGTRVVFISEASNLVAGDTNSAPDVFLRDIPSGMTYRINLSSSPTNAQATGQSTSSYGLDNDINAWISGDGQHVLIVSSATNLVANDTNNRYDIFVRDINNTNPQNGTTERVSVSTSGQQSNNFSWFHYSSISHDGSKVTFNSQASNLVPGDTNGKYDVFVRNRTAGTTTRVSVPYIGGQYSTGSGDPTISRDGSTVSFSEPSLDGSKFCGYLVNTDGTNLKYAFVDNSGNPEPGSSAFPALSYDGRYYALMAFPSLNDMSKIAVLFVDTAAYCPSVAKRKIENDSIILSDGYVSAAFDGSFYLQQVDGGCSGIRVEWAGDVNIGKRYCISGTVKTNPDNERYVLATSVDPYLTGWTSSVKPKLFTNKALGGRAWYYTSSPISGQIGVSGGESMNNIGLLVKTTGRCTYVDSHTFTIDDGSNVLVTCETPSTILASTAWQQVFVTGISSIKTDGAVRSRRIRVVGVDPVLVQPQDNVTGRWEMLSTTGPSSGVIGMLATQSGTSVGGTVVQGVITNGQISSNVFTGGFQWDSTPFQFSLTQIGNTLSGTLTVNGGSAPVTFQRLSTNPISPYAGRPKVLSASCNGSSIFITWDRPVMGWDFDIVGPGVSNASNYADKSNFTWDPATNTYRIALLPTIPLVPGAVYTVKLDNGATVNWHDPFGVPAWDSVAKAYSFTFTMP